MDSDKSDIFDLIKTGEGYTIEFKESLSGSLGKEICAFANASGGKIILGVKDDATIIGFNLTNRDKSQILDIARNMDPPLHIVVEKVSNLAVIYVSEGKEKPYAVNGHFYIRQGSNSQQLKRDEIRGLFHKENLISFEKKTNNDFVNDDFSKDAFDFFLKKSGISNSLSREHILKNLGLMTDERLNNTGVLFFSKNISKYFLNSIIGCVLYAGETKTKILDKREFDEDFISNLNSAITFSLRNLRTEYIIEKLEREEKPEISEEILRELIINAMVHRDYFSNGRVLVEIFSNRVEISNPGGLLFDEKEFGKRSFSRNPLLVDLVHRLRIVERVGSGINRVKEALKEDVKFELFFDWFRVIIFRKVSQNPAKTQPKPSQKFDKDERKKLIIELIKKGNFTKRGFAKDLVVNKSTIESDLKELKQEGVIDYSGPKKGGRWKIVKG